MTPDKITNHKALAVGYLLSELQDSPKLKKLIEIFAEEIQELEDLYYQLATERTIDTAEGVQLDHIGKKVRWLRNGMDDDDYRKMIRCAVTINTTHGLAKTAKSIMAVMVDAVVWYVQRGRAHYGLIWERATNTPEPWCSVIRSIMDKITASGVSWELVEGNNGTNPVFRFDTPGAGYDLGGLARRVD